LGLIRLVLAFGVLLAHMNQQILPPLGLIADFRLSMSLAGGVPVVFFYVVSGFLVSFVLGSKYPRGIKVHLPSINRDFSESTRYG
jgi:peptidoglycan/LPS O-acetylase OafA/YrhL